MTGWRLYLVRNLVGLAVLAACSRATATPSRPAATAEGLTGSPTAGRATAAPTALPTPVPSDTPEPLAASVNGQPIALSDYDVEVQRCQSGKAAAGYDAGDCPSAALQSLIEQSVVNQAAQAAGLQVSDAETQAALDQIEAAQGSPQAFDAWLAANHYTADEFRAAVRDERLRARLAEQIVAQVGPAAEQVHARQILVTSEAVADDVLAQLQAGADFATLALGYSRDLSSRAAGGDLGWFPRGLLTTPEVESAAFALQPGETSGVIHSALGYHIVQVLERDPARPLSPAAAQALRAAAFSNWLDQLVAAADIVRYVTP